MQDEREVRISALGKNWIINLSENSEVSAIYVMKDDTRIYEDVPTVMWDVEIDGFTLVDLLGDLARDVPLLDELSDDEADYAYNMIGEGR